MTIIIIIFTLLISYVAFRSQTVMRKLIHAPYMVKNKNEYYRFVTSGFIHGNWIHLLINMFVLYSFGGIVEFYYHETFGSHGTIYYIILYIGSIIVSDISTFIKQQNNPHYASLGASGAVSAVLFCFILFNPLENLYLYGILPIPGIAAGILYLIYSAYMAKKGTDHINHNAHFYGAVFGFGFTLLLKPELFINFINQLTQWL